MTKQSKPTSRQLPSLELTNFNMKARRKNLSRLKSNIRRMLRNLNPIRKPTKLKSQVIKLNLTNRRVKT
jgi:5-bromo-4-chloroindolyl phosphate hydrolysis protein